MTLNGTSVTTDSRPIALITGATRGIGKAIAIALAPSHHLILHGRERALLEASANELPSAEVLTGDLTHDDVVESLELPEKLDVLVHAAGAYVGSTIESATVAEWRRIFDINVFAAANLTRHAMPSLRNARGLVVFINSAAGFVANPGWGLYAASKFALRATADSLRAEIESTGVRVTSVYPARTDTDMQHEVVATRGEVYDAKRFLAPDEIAAMVRAVVDLPATAVVENLTIRTMPRG